MIVGFQAIMADFSFLGQKKGFNFFAWGMVVESPKCVGFGGWRTCNGQPDLSEGLACDWNEGHACIYYSVWGQV